MFVGWNQKIDNDFKAFGIQTLDSTKLSQNNKLIRYEQRYAA